MSAGEGLWSGTCADGNRWSEAPPHYVEAYRGWEDPTRPLRARRSARRLVGVGLHPCAHFAPTAPRWSWLRRCRCARCSVAPWGWRDILGTRNNSVVSAPSASWLVEWAPIQTSHPFNLVNIPIFLALLL